MKKYAIRKAWGRWLLIFSDGHYISLLTFEEAVAEMDRRIALCRNWVW